MEEFELYKICELRCPACEIKVVSEIECMQKIKVGDDVLDSCPRCGFLGNFKILAFLVLLLLSVQSWATCTTSVNKQCRGWHYKSNGNFTCNISSGRKCSYSSFSACNSVTAVIETCDNTIQPIIQCTDGGSRYCSDSEIFVESTCTITLCTSQAESDSVNCVNQNMFWVNGQCKSSLCDSTNWTCTTTTETTQTTVASDNITCIDGTCFGLTYCDYISRSITSCDNECGQHTEQTNEVPMRYEGACNPDNLSDDNMCSSTKCIEFTGGYSLYQLCQSREVLNGEIQLLPRMVGGGLGSCKNAGYNPSNDSLNGSGSGGSDTTSIPQECYTMGINCPSPDTTKYSDPENRTEENGCKCEPYDGLSSISRIVCPDGSMSVIYSSCDNWRNRPQSSSSAPESSSSGSENPPASSGAGSDLGNWTTYSQGEDIKGILGVIATNTAKLGNQNVVVTQQQEFLNQFEYQDDGVEPTLNVPDSMLSFDSVSVDTAGILDAIFNRLDSTNRILDTIPAVTGVCPCITFFQGSQAQFVGHLRFPEIKIDFADFNGWNLCTIISSIVVALASVVSFFIGFSIFKNISQ